MAKRKLQQDLNLQQLKVQEWVKSNRGVLSRVAVRCNVGISFVSQVAYGTSRNRPGHVVEQELKAAGWPGYKRRGKTPGIGGYGIR